MSKRDIGSGRSLPLLVVLLLLVTGLAAPTVTGKLNVQDRFADDKVEIVDINGTQGAPLDGNITLPRDAHVLSANVTIEAVPAEIVNPVEISGSADFGAGSDVFNMSVDGEDLILHTDTFQWLTDTEEQWNEGLFSNLKMTGGTATMDGIPGGYANEELTSEAVAAEAEISAVSDGTDIHAVWADGRADATGDIYYAQSTDNGVTFGTNKIVTSDASGQRVPRIAVHGNSLHVIYQHSTGNAGCEVVTMYTKSVNDGDTWSAPINLTCSVHPDFIGYANIAVDSNDNPWVVANHEKSGAGRWVYFTHSTNGGTSFEPVDFFFQPIVNVQPTVAIDNNDNPWILFKEEKAVRLWNTTDGGTSWWATRIDKPDSKTFLGRAHMVIDSQNRIHIAWRDYRAGNNDVWYSYAEINPDLSVEVSPNIAVGTDKDGNEQNSPFIAVDGQDNVYITISDWRDDDEGDVYFAMSKTRGEYWSGLMRVDDMQGVSTITDPLVVFGGNDRPVFMWTDGRNGGVEIFKSLGSTLGTSYYSEVLDCGQRPSAITNFEDTKSEPAGTNASTWLRSSEDGISWMNWGEVFGNNLSLVEWDRFIQWKIDFLNTTQSPSVEKVDIEYVIVSKNGHWVSADQTVQDLIAVRARWNLTPNAGSMFLALENDTESTKIGKNAWKAYSPDDGVFRLNVSMVQNGMSPRLHQLFMDYKINVYARNPVLRFGSSPVDVWARSGEYRGSENVDIAQYLNDYIMEVRANTNLTQIRIPLNVTFVEPGTIKLRGLHIEYDREPSEPSLQTPADGAYLPNEIEKFEVRSSDADAEALKYEVQISDTQAFMNVLKTFGTDNGGWDKTQYFPEVTATLKPLDNDKLDPGAYFWRARAYDGTVWSQFSAVQRFTIDDTVPAGGLIDEGETTISMDTLVVDIDVDDPESGIIAIDYGVGSQRNGTDIKAKSSHNVSNDTITITGLKLVAGPIYYVWIKAQNGAGMWSDFINTDGITLAVPEATLSYGSGTLEDTKFPVTLGGSDPGGADIIDGDLEFSSATISQGKPGSWGDWREVGGENGGDMDVTEFEGTQGIAYKLRYRVKSEHGFWSGYTVPDHFIRINGKPTAKITGPASATIGKKSLFSASTTTNPDGDNLTYEWDIAGKKYDTEDVEHKWTSAGKKSVKLKVCDAYICDETTMEVSIKDDALISTEMAIGLGATIGIVVALVVVLMLMRMKKKKKAEAEKKDPQTLGQMQPMDGQAHPYPPPPPPPPPQQSQQQDPYGQTGYDQQQQQYPPPPPPPPPQQY